MPPTHSFPDPPPPSRGWKTVRRLVGGLAGLAALFVLGSYALGSLWVLDERRGERRVAEFRRAGAEGVEAGAGTDEAGCVRLAQARKSTSGAEEDDNRIFTVECLRHARRTPGFCEAVPAPDLLPGADAWVRSRCPGGGEACERVMEVVSGYCDDGRPGPTDPSAE